jgi:hypothetical protein
MDYSFIRQQQRLLTLIVHQCRVLIIIVAVTIVILITIIVTIIVIVIIMIIIVIVIIMILSVRVGIVTFWMISAIPRVEDILTIMIIIVGDTLFRVIVGDMLTVQSIIRIMSSVESHLSSIISILSN